MTIDVQSAQMLENRLIGPVPSVVEVRLEPIAKRVRAIFAGIAIADSCRVIMMFETSHLPVYYFPDEDARIDLLVATSTNASSVQKGEATYYKIAVEGRTVDGAAWRYLAPPEGCPPIAGYVAFHWKLMDAWLEEDDEVFVHARDPYHRIDVLNSGRKVRVVSGGETIALSTRARFLFETGLPVRYYMPIEDVRTDLLEPSEASTACAYKGSTTGYWKAPVEDGSLQDIAWCYEHPNPEVAGIAGMVAFFNERVDAIYVDGEKMPSPQTPWSLHQG